jgi:hypothetical protein
LNLQAGTAYLTQRSRFAGEATFADSPPGRNGIAGPGSRKDVAGGAACSEAEKPFGFEQMGWGKITKAQRKSGQ